MIKKILFLSIIFIKLLFPNSSLAVKQVYSDRNKNNNALNSNSGLPSNQLKLWLNADNLNQLSDSSLIDMWADSSGNNHNFFQTTGINKPLLIKNIHELNGHSALLFSSTDFLTDSIKIGALINYTIFAVFRPNSTSSGCIYGAAAPTDEVRKSYANLFTYGSSGALIKAESYYGNDIQASVATTPDGTFPKDSFCIMNYVHQDGISHDKIFKNNFELNNISYTGSASNTGVTPYEFCIGRYGGTPNYYWKGLLAELIIYTDTLSSTDKDLVFSYLKNKYAPPVDLGPDILIDYGFCDTTVQTNNYYLQYNWSNNDTNSYTNTQISQQLSLTVTDIFGYSSVDTIDVVFPNINHPAITNLICEYSSLEWNTFLPKDLYNHNWSNSSADSIITITQAGSYFVTITDSVGCQFHSDTVLVSIDNYPSVTTLGTDTALCKGNAIGLLNNQSQTISYLWSTGDTTSTLSIDTSGLYILQTTSTNNCVAKDTIYVSISGDAPLVNFSYNTKCVNDATMFMDISDSTSSTINSWEWNFGDNDTSALQNPGHIYTSPGTYNVSLLVTSVDGCKGSVIKPIIIYKQPIANFYNYWSCNNFNTQIFNSSNLFGNALASTLWDFGDPASGLSDSSTAGNPLHLFSNAGNHNVQLIITTQNGCVDTVSRIIDTKPAPVANFTTSATCENVPVQFSDISNYQTPYSNYKRTWYFGDNTSIGPNAAGTISHNYSFPPTSYTAILHVISNSGCQDTVSKIINIEKVPNAALGFSHNCPNELTILTNQSSISSGSIQNVIWNIQNQYYTGDTLNLQLGVGTYPITMTVTSDHNCTDDVIKVVTVLPLPVASFSLDSYFGNPPFEVQPENTSTGATNYFWDFGNTETSTAFEPVITYNDSGHFALSLVAFNSDNCTDTAIRYIDIIPSHLDIAVLSLRVNNKNNYSETIAELANLGTVEVTSMDLVINSDNDIQVKEAWTGSILPGSAITYTLKTSVRLSGESEYLCLSAENINAKTDEKPENNKDCNVLNTNFSLPLPTPNPATSSIKIPVIIPEKSTVKIEVYNSGAAGLLKSELNLQKGINFIELDINEWNSGAYFYRINFNGQWLSKSFIKSQQ